MSGSNPKCSEARNLPVRPVPDWTSSAITRMPWRSQSSFTPRRKSGEGTTNPPSPWIGSMTAQATDPGSTTVVNARCIAASATSPARSGSGLRYGYAYGRR